MSKRNLLSFAAVSVLVLSLTGCTNGEGFEFTQLEDTVVASESGYVMEDATSIIVTLGGSSSCPPVIKKVSSKAEKVIIQLKDYADVACTADFKLTSYRVKANDSSFDFGKSIVTACSNDVCNDLTGRKLEG